MRDSPQAASAYHQTSLRLARNSAWNLVALFATIAVHFITVPVVIARIGLGEFGNAGLVLALWAPLLLVGTVIGQALTRELGIRGANHDPASVRRMTESASFVWVASTIVAWLFLGLLGPALLSHFTANRGSAERSFWQLAIAGIGWAAQQGSLMLQGASTAYQSYRVVAWVTVVTSAVTIGAIFVFTNAIPDGVGYLAGLSAGFCFGLILWLTVARATKAARYLVPRMHREELHSLFSFGKWQGLAYLTGNLANQVDRYLLGALALPIIVGQYNAAKRPQEAAFSVASKLAEVLFPHFASTAQADAAQQARFYLLASWAVMTCGAMVVGPAIPLADAIMRLWVGPKVALGGAQLMRTLMLGGLFGCGANVFTYYLMGVGKNAQYALISSFYSSLAIILSIVIIHRWGGYAAGVGLAIAGGVRVVASLGLMKFRILRNIRVRELLTSSAAPLVAGALCAYLWRLVPAIDRIDAWSIVMLAYLGIAVSIGAAICMVTAPTAFGRSAIAWSVNVARGFISHRGFA